jgi:ABC-type bacteriocin/lantibiotic exporter with double-glycine peptidase domain
LEVFAAHWTGELILITSRASLAGELAKFDFSWFIPSLVKHRKLLGEVLLISFILQLFALVSPLFFQVVMDKVLVHRGLTTLDVLVIGLLVVVVFESAAEWLRSYVFSHTTSRIDVELGARLFRHLVQLPLAYFQARRVGDSVARVRELENIRSFLTGNALTVLLDVVFSIVFIVVMLFYSVPLTLIVLVSMPLYCGLSLAVVPGAAQSPGREVRPRRREPGHAGGDRHRHPDRQGQRAGPAFGPPLGQPARSLCLAPASEPRTLPAGRTRASTSSASSSMPPRSGTARTWS